MSRPTRPAAKARTSSGRFRREAEAQNALATAHARTEKWDDEDREWDERGASETWKAADDTDA
ncbi:MAG: methionine aminopeptidase [Dermatophilaceae bacterium]